MLTPAHVETYCRIKSDPFHRSGFDVLESLIFCEKVESRLAGLSDFERNLVLMQAYGYSQRDIAVMADVSMRTIVRRARRINDALFAELAEALGCRVALRRAPGGGRKKKQAA